MITTVAYSANQDTSGILTYVAGVQDQHVNVSGNNIIVPSDVPMFAGAFAVGTSLSLAQIESPSLKRMMQYDISPLDTGSSLTTPHRFTNRFNAPIQLQATEAMRALAAESGAGAAQQTVIVWLTDGKYNDAKGEIFTVRCTGTTTLTAYTWTNCPLTFTQSLPAGNYSVVGMRVVSAGAIAGRLVFVGGPWRPGVLGCLTILGLDYPIFRNGGLGELGTFNHQEPPSVDVLSASADTAQTVFLDLVKNS